MESRVDIRSGQALARVTKSSSLAAKSYKVFGISELREDLDGIVRSNSPSVITTEETLPVLQGGELVMSLIDPVAGCVQPKHSGYVLSQNFVELTPGPAIDPGYLLFLLNESKDIKKQIQNGYQNSTLLKKVPISILKSLKLPSLPDLQTQKLIGEKYAAELKLRMLQDRRNELRYKKAIEEMRRVVDD